MPHGSRRGGLPVAGAVVAVVLAACGSGPAAHVTTPARPSPATTAAAGSPQPYQLYTHCGIDEARIGNRYYRAVHPLSDGQRPATRAGETLQQGTMTLLSPAEAVFRDGSAYHQVHPAASRRHSVQASVRVNWHGTGHCSATQPRYAPGIDRINPPNPPPTSLHKRCYGPLEPIQLPGGKIKAALGFWPDLIQVF